MDMTTNSDLTLEVGSDFFTVDPFKAQRHKEIHPREGLNLQSNTIHHHFILYLLNVTLILKIVTKKHTLHH